MSMTGSPGSRSGVLVRRKGRKSKKGDRWTLGVGRFVHWETRHLGRG